jgi:pyroglutamyl-peptidase
MAILLTGFGPFGQTRRNPSEQIVAALAGTTIGGHEVVGSVLPVSAERTPPAVRAALAGAGPELALALLLGVAPAARGCRSSVWP